MQPGAAAGSSVARARPFCSRAEWLPLALLAAAWCVGAAIANPVGDFPLNDDWGYGLPVKHLLESGDLQLTDWQSMPLVTQIIWGGLFVLPNGFSFTALRLSTLTLGGLAGIGFYLILRHVGMGRATSGLGAATLLAWPVHVGLSHTFMTDVPYLAFSTWSALFLLRGVAARRTDLLVIGMVLTILSVLLRQIGIALAIAYALAVFFSRPWSRLGLATALLAPAAAVAALLGWNAYLEATAQVPALYHAKAGSLTDSLADILTLRLGALRNPLERSGWLLLYTGLQALPFLVALAPDLLRDHFATRFGRLALATAVVAAALSATVLVQQQSGIPALGNLLLDLGLGPRTVPGPTLPGFGASLWWVVNFGAVLGALGIAVLCWRALRNARANDGSIWMTVFLTTVVILVFAPISLAYGAIFDRYFLSIAPWLIVLAAVGASATQVRASRASLVGGYAIALLYFGFATAAVHDYLAFNRTRWEAGSWLLARSGGSPAAIDGGFEWNNYLRLLGSNRWQHLEAPAIDRDGAAFAIVFSASEDEVVLARFPVDSWLPRAPSELIAVRRPGRE